MAEEDRGMEKGNHVESSEEGQIPEQDPETKGKMDWGAAEDTNEKT